MVDEGNIILFLLYAAGAVMGYTLYTKKRWLGAVLGMVAVTALMTVLALLMSP